jgi:hypothetical protein
MKAWLIGAGMLAALPALAQQMPPAIPFDSNANFLRLPTGMYFGEAAGVAVDSKKHIYVFSRGNTSGPNFGAAASQILEFTPDGSFIREIGHNLYGFGYAHAVRVDRHDNLWAVDKGTDTIVKFSRDANRVEMIFGRRQEASGDTVPWKLRMDPPLPHENGRFRQPTDVTFDSKDNAYFSDGYVNARVAKVDKNGKWLMSFGEHGKAEGQFDTPHSITIDQYDHIYVADRNNQRVQVFDTNGKFLRAISVVDVPFSKDAQPAIGNPLPPDKYKTAGTQGPGAPWAVCIPPKTDVLYFSDAFPGRIYKTTLDGKLLGVLGEAGKRPKEFGWIHEMACPSENELYVAEVLNWRVQKLTLHPSKAEMANTNGGARATRASATR